MKEMQNFFEKEINDFIYEKSNLSFDFSKSCRLSHISKYQLSNNYISVIEGNKIIITKKLKKYTEKTMIQKCCARDPNPRPRDYESRALTS